ncbi:class I SAM-dependent methyltransferase [Rathayibacter sp. CAU 1779]
MSARPAGNYGIDAPGVPWGWGIATVVSPIAAVVFAVIGAAAWLPVYFAVLAVIAAVGTFFYLRSTLVGKFEVWRRVITALHLRGDEQVLDLGCGHATVSVLLAERLPNGRVTGIDLWRSVDQSGNSAEAAQRNAQANGVDARISLDTGDMTALPYPAASFDLVTASLAIHNVRTADGRRTAVLEAVRVLKPGGRLVIVDIEKVREYVTVVSDAGLAVAVNRGLGWRMWWTGPWFPTRLLIATRPAA